jgi:small subunit ribosomal protein S1
MAKRSFRPDDDAAETPSEDLSFAAILQEFEQSHKPAGAPQGDAGREGVVVSIAGGSVFVDIGYKTEGIVPASEFRDDPVKPGDKLKVSVTGRDPEGYYTLSKIRVERPKDWSSLERAFADKSTIAGNVTGIIKGGFTVDVGVRAFMPASRSGVRDNAEMEALVGQSIACRIIKLDTADEDVVVDRRVVLEMEEAEARERMLSGLKEGAVVAGTVRTLMDYGAFVDIGGVDGLLHVADISRGRVAKPADVLTVGQTVQVQILKVDAAKRRISLGMKQLQADPWSTAAEKYVTGEKVRGTVSRVTDFGAFVELEPGLEGLIHLSEMSWAKKARKPAEIVKSGESVEVVVLGVNPGERRIALGLKQAMGDPWAELERRLPVGAVVEGPVTSLTNFGAFVDLGDGIEGMIHVGDMSAEKRINHPKEAVKTGERVRTVVLELDRQKRRIRLGLKQLQPTTMDEYIGEHKKGDLVTGRVGNISSNRARVELGDGIHASCGVAEAPEGGAQETTARPDVSALSSMLTNKWKLGATGGLPGKREPLKPGQVRSFRIVELDASQKRIEVELAG